MSDRPNLSELLTTRVEKLGLSRIDRHVFICADATKSLCCDSATGLAAWEYLKNRLRELGLDQPSETQGSVFRTKANCLRVCTDGPILLIYPEGVWYKAATAEAIERIIQEHLIGNQVVSEYVFHQQVLPHTIV
jgi:(2Fe-2S) ferredoxin